jgi:hypothetical protein
VVAAHNNGLRSWLRSDGRGDASAAVDHALTHVQQIFGPERATDGPPLGPGAGGDDDVVVVVSRRGAPLWRVVQEMETTLGRDPA